MLCQKTVRTTMKNDMAPRDLRLHRLQQRKLERNDRKAMKLLQETDKKNERVEIHKLM